MGSPHLHGSQEALHKAFRGFPGLAVNHIKLALERLAKKVPGRPLRVLDIGAGSVPYRRAFELSGERIDLTLFDRHEVILAAGSSIKGACLHLRQLRKDFFDLFDLTTGDYKTEIADNDRLGKFDLVVLAATVHELYFDAVAVYGRPEDFHSKLLHFIHDNLLSDGGMLIIADYAWPIYARAEHTRRIQILQNEKRGHADPPWAFIRPSDLQLIAFRSGFLQRSSGRRGLYDKLDANNLNGPSGEFGGELTTEELATARLRIGYVITFLWSDLPAWRERRALPLQVPLLRRKASVYVSTKAEEALRGFVEDEAGVSNSLNEAFVKPVPALGNKSALWHLASAIREDALTCLQNYQLDSPKTYEIWFGVGLKKLGSRFVPKLLCPWTEGGLRREAGVLSSAKRIPSWAEVDVIAGPVSDIYDKAFGRRGRNAPTIHKWANALHESLRHRDSIKEVNISQGKYRKNAEDFSELRSVTVILAERPGEAASSLALSALWGDYSAQEASGHYLRILRQDQSEGSLVMQLGRFLRRVAMSVAGIALGLEEAIDELSISSECSRAEQIREGIEVYHEFLTSVFAAGDHQGPAGKASERFNAWWKTLPGTTDGICYNFFSTIIVGCDGLSPSPPDTIMIFGEQAFPPLLLDKIDDLAFDLFRRLSDVEAAVVREKEVQALERVAQQRQSLVSFGHDGKRPALTILRVVDGDWSLDDKVAVTRFLANSLWMRLGSYSSLIGWADTPDQARALLVRDEQNATSYVPISAIWRRELICVLLRCIVDGSSWAKIRKALWSEDSRLSDQQIWAKLRLAFEPILGLQRDDEIALIDDKLASAMEKVTHALALDKIDICFFGNDLQVPQTCSGQDGLPTESRLAIALAFLFGEIATNTFRHQFPRLASVLKADGLTSRLDIEAEPDGYRLCCEFLPIDQRMVEPKTDYRDVQDKAFTGLTSIQSIVAAIGCSAEEATFRWRAKRSDASGKLPFFTIIRDSAGRPISSRWTIRGLVRNGVRNV